MRLFVGCSISKEWRTTRLLGISIPSHARARRSFPQRSTRAFCLTVRGLLTDHREPNVEHRERMVIPCARWVTGERNKKKKEGKEIAATATPLSPEIYTRPRKANSFGLALLVLRHFSQETPRQNRKNLTMTKRQRSESQVRFCGFVECFVFGNSLSFVLFIYLFL